MADTAVEDWSIGLGWVGLMRWKGKVGGWKGDEYCDWSGGMGCEMSCLRYEARMLGIQIFLCFIRRNISVQSVSLVMKGPAKQG